MPLSDAQTRSIERIRESGEISAVERGQLAAWLTRGDLTGSERSQLRHALAIERAPADASAEKPKSIAEARKALRDNPVAIKAMEDAAIRSDVDDPFRYVRDRLDRD